MSKQLKSQEKMYELQMQMHQEQIQKLSSRIPIYNCHETQNSSFEPFNSQYISEDRMPHVFLSNQSRETFQLIKTAASQMSTPKNINSLLWCEIFSIMNSNFSQRTFVVIDRNRFYTELKRKTGESVSESASRVRQKANTCYFESISDTLNETLKTGSAQAIFHKSTSDFTFSRIVNIVAEVEDASRTPQKQISEDVKDVQNFTAYQENFVDYHPVKTQCFSCGGTGYWQQDCHISKACMKRANTPRQSKPIFDNVNNVISSVRDIILRELVVNIFNVRFDNDTGSMDSFISTSNWTKLGKPTLGKVSIKCFSVTCGQRMMMVFSKQVFMTENNHAIS
ncbi:hypothetical protein RF11_05708 [Thelohanellus kitauei]|uniref:CCHC-type domain-containing protein n=1 Tax=Thelohanellus kitauei TaxID=669202 RepID=A0A0C2NJD5_THEKT|nr:hypothetical protein RF11_05708 [Thelohanellus kitauei]